MSEFAYTLSDGRSVLVTFRRNAVNASMRLGSSGQLKATVPFQYFGKGIDRLLENLYAQLKPRLEKANPTFVYRVPSEIVCPDAKIQLAPYEKKPLNVKSEQLAQGQYRIEIGREIDLRQPEATTLITNHLLHIGRHVVLCRVIPRAMEIAKRLGCSVSDWNIGRGTRTLGTCNRQRQVRISAAVAFLPLELQEYIVCHELAHLTHMDHSPRFHALCDQYLGGRERQLIRQLHAYPWPIAR